MSKYSEIEIQTAKNLLENGYMWIVRYETGRLIGLSEKPIKRDNLWESFGNTVFVCRYVPIFQSIRSDDKEPVSLESIVHPQILDDVEKRYLSSVIKPFRDRVESILKVNFLGGAFQHIVIGMTADTDIALPDFKSGTMYKGMEPGHSYTLEELGL